MPGQLEQRPAQSLAADLPSQQGWIRRSRFRRRLADPMERTTHVHRPAFAACRYGDLLLDGRCGSRRFLRPTDRHSPERRRNQLEQQDHRKTMGQCRAACVAPDQPDDRRPAATRMALLRAICQITPMAYPFVPRSFFRGSRGVSVGSSINSRNACRSFGVRLRLRRQMGDDRRQRPAAQLVGQRAKPAGDQIVPVGGSGEGVNK